MASGVSLQTGVAEDRAQSTEPKPAEADECEERNWNTLVESKAAHGSCHRRTRSLTGTVEEGHVRTMTATWHRRVRLLLFLLALSSHGLCAQAQCNFGYTGPDAGPCVACPKGTYKDVLGNHTCVRCGMGGTTPEASVSQANCTCSAGFSGAYRVRTAPWQSRVLAGSDGDSGRLDGAGTDARLSEPRGLSFSPDATFLAVSVWNTDDANFSAVRLVNMSSGFVRTHVGGTASGFVDGVGADAKFNGPAGVAYSPDGSYIAVAGRN